MPGQFEREDADFMNLHEYQAKQLFAEVGVPVPKGRVARTVDEAVKAGHELGGSVWVVKAQVHAGGRGKAGGVKVVKSESELREFASKLLGSKLHTHQTGPEGLPINAVMVEQGLAIDRELYLSAVVDRACERVVFMGSAAGGMDIEEVAATEPEKIFTTAVDPAAGLQPYQARQFAFGLGLKGDQVGALVKIMSAMYRLFIEKDLSLVEINPLIVTKEGQLLALDGKINVDDNALYRQATVEAMRDPSQEDEKERAAHQHDLNYVTLDGDIACMVNGAGLAMATMDIIKLHGGEPANFLDVGGGATAARVAEAFKIIVSDRKVKAILVNIFGGIVRCDLISEGIIQAVKEVGVNVPVVVRLQGTNVDQGNEMLRNSGLAVIAVSDLTEAAKRVVAAAAGK
jgi:succinyl-CoA synthetase beta subunit